MIKAIPDAIGAVLGIAIGGNQGSIQDSFTNNEPDYPISVDPRNSTGIRQRNTIELAPLNRETARGIKNRAMIRDNIENKERMDNLSRLSDDSLCEHLGELIDGYEDYDPSELEDVPLLLDEPIQNTPYIRLRDRRRLLRKAVLITGIATIPIAGGTSVGPTRELSDP